MCEDVKQGFLRLSTSKTNNYPTLIRPLTANPTSRCTAEDLAQEVWESFFIYTHTRTQFTHSHNHSAQAHSCLQWKCLNSKENYLRVCDWKLRFCSCKLLSEHFLHRHVEGLSVEIQLPLQQFYLITFTFKWNIHKLNFTWFQAQVTEALVRALSL